MIYQQTADISMGTNCALLMADLFLLLSVADFVHLRQSKFKKQKLKSHLTSISDREMMFHRE